MANGNLWTKEPVLVLGGAGVLVHDLIGVLSAFGYPLTPAQEGAIVTLLGTILTFWARSRVSPIPIPAPPPPPMGPRA